MKLEYIPVGRIVNAHGTRGEVRLQPDGLSPDFLTRFETWTASPSAPPRTTSTRASSC